MKVTTILLLLLALGGGTVRASSFEGLTARVGVRGGASSELTLKKTPDGPFVEIVLGLFSTKERTAEFFILPLLHVSRGGLFSYEEISLAAGVDSYRTKGGVARGTSFAFTVGLANIRGDTIRTDDPGAVQGTTKDFTFKDQTVTTYGAIAERFAAFEAAPRLFRKAFLEIKGLRAEGSSVSDLEALSDGGFERSSRFVQLKAGVGLFYPF